MWHGTELARAMHDSGESDRCDRCASPREVEALVAFVSELSELRDPDTLMWPWMISTEGFPAQYSKVWSAWSSLWFTGSVMATK